MRKILGRQSLGAARSALSFSLIPAVAVLVPLAVLPIISITYGADGLLSVAIGQSIGSVAGLAVGLSYPLTGSNAVARMDQQERIAYYKQSVESRLLVYLGLSPLLALTAGLLVQRYVDVAVLGALANGALGFTAFWYYSGIGKPRDLLVFEVVPRVLAAALTIPAILSDAPLFTYPLLLLLAAAVGVVMNLRTIQGGFCIRISRDTVWQIRLQFMATLSRIANGLYFTGATSIVAVFTAAPITLVFSAADRVQKSAYNGGIIFPQALVSWVAHGSEDLRPRQRTALVLDSLYCVAISSVLFLLYPVLVRFMFQGVVEVDLGLQILSSLSLGMAVFSKCLLFHLLLPRGLESESSLLLVSGSILGALGVSLGAIFFGADGAAAAILGTEIVLSVGAIGVSIAVHRKSVSSF